MASPSTTYLLGTLDDITWYEDNMAGVIPEGDQRPSWKVSYANYQHLYIDAITGQFIAAGSYENRP